MPCKKRKKVSADIKKKKVDADIEQIKKECLHEKNSKC